MWLNSKPIVKLKQNMYILCQVLWIGGSAMLVNQLSQKLSNKNVIDVATDDNDVDDDNDDNTILIYSNFRYPWPKYSYYS